MRVDELRETLAGVGLAPAFPEGALGDLAPVASVRRLGREEILWRAGTPSRGLYIVLAGRIRVVRAREGRQHLVHLGWPGDTMGEVALFGDGVYPATAVAAEPSSCLVLPRGPLLELLARDASVAHALLERVARRTGGLVERLEAQTLGPVRARLAGSLLALARQGDDDVVRVSEPQAAWAETLGTVREVLARELRTLRDGGLIEKVGVRSYRILDAVGLEEVASGRVGVERSRPSGPPRSEDE